ncbi:hypothetical protein ACQ4WY_18970 [Janthinobacterium sp. LB2P49]|uniref:hypothetical protein n=1 Tax=Janthinobacterium sp. LB2P49 TaxID=3424198 RepID=UPI003F2926FC
MMRFQINEVQADGDWVPLTDHRVSDSLENIFTLIVGQNAVGKSRLLRKIVSNYIFPQVSRIKSSIIPMHYYNNWYPKVINKENKNWNYENYFEIGDNPPSFNPYLYGGHNFDLDEVRVSSYSISLPSTVIAVSTGRHDRFPSAANVKDKELMAEYRYIGTDQFSKNSISSSLISLLEGLLQGRQNLHKLSDIFEYLGFAPYLDVKLSLDKKQYSKLKDEERRELHNESNQPLLDFLMGEGSRFHNNYLPGGDFLIN